MKKFIVVAVVLVLVLGLGMCSPKKETETASALVIEPTIEDSLFDQRIKLEVSDLIGHTYRYDGLNGDPNNIIALRGQPSDETMQFTCPLIGNDLYTLYYVNFGTVGNEPVLTANSVVKYRNVNTGELEVVYSNYHWLDDRYRTIFIVSARMYFSDEYSYLDTIAKYFTYCDADTLGTRDFTLTALLYNTSYVVIDSFVTRETPLTVFDPPLFSVYNNVNGRYYYNYHWEKDNVTSSMDIMVLRATTNEGQVVDIGQYVIQNGQVSPFVFYQSYRSLLYDNSFRFSSGFYYVDPTNDTSYVMTGINIYTYYYLYYNYFAYSADLSNDPLYQSGFNAGYAKGISDYVSSGTSQSMFYDLMFAVVQAPISVLHSTLDVNVLGVNLSSFFFGLLSVCLVVFVIRKLL